MFMTKKRFIRDILSFRRIQKCAPHLVQMNSVSNATLQKFLYNRIDLDALDKACQSLLKGMNPNIIYSDPNSILAKSISTIILDRLALMNSPDEYARNFRLLQQHIYALIVWEYALFRKFPISHRIINHRIFLYRHEIVSVEEASISRLNGFLERHSIPENSHLSTFLEECRVLSLGLRNTTHTLLLGKDGNYKSLYPRKHTWIVPFSFTGQEYGNRVLIFSVSKGGMIKIERGLCKKENDNWVIRQKENTNWDIETLPRLSLYGYSKTTPNSILTELGVTDDYLVIEPLDEMLGHTEFSDMVKRVKHTKLESSVAYYLHRCLLNGPVLNALLYKFLMGTEHKGIPVFKSLRRHNIEAAPASFSRNCPYKYLLSHPYYMEFLDNYPFFAKVMIKYIYGYHNDTYESKVNEDFINDINDAVINNTSINTVLQAHGYNDKRFVNGILKAKTRQIKLDHTIYFLTDDFMKPLYALWLRFDMAGCLNRNTLSKSEYNKRRMTIIKMAQIMNKVGLPIEVLETCRPQEDWFTSDILSQIGDTIDWLNNIYLSVKKYRGASHFTLFNIGLISTVEDVIRLTKWHHNNLERSNNLSSKFLIATGSTWVSPIENFSCSSGTIEFLTTEMALRQEGLEMSHCIGSYRMRGFSGQSIMGSVKGNDGTRSSITFSGFFSIDHQERPLKEVFIEEENKSYGNSTPTGDVLDVVEQFKRTIPELRTKDYSVYIDTTKEKKRNQRNLVLQNIVDNIKDNMNDFALLFKKRDKAYTFAETLASIARILK